MDSKVVVLVSTYNGQDVVGEQLDSLLAQSVPPYKIIVRDDGSSDGTLALLAEYKASYPDVFNIIPASNIGVTRSFFELIYQIPPEADYAALCDQDDRWHPDKIEAALHAMKDAPKETVAMYCSALTECDEHLTPQCSYDLNRLGIEIHLLLYENICSGNTMMLNRAFIDLLQDNKVANDAAYCHDWWLALVAACNGQIIYDKTSHIDYRRTRANVSPNCSSPLSLFAFRVKRFLINNDLEHIRNQIAAANLYYGESLPPSLRSILSTAASANRFQRAFSPYRLRQKMSDELSIRLLLIAGRL